MNAMKGLIGAVVLVLVGWAFVGCASQNTRNTEPVVSVAPHSNERLAQCDHAPESAATSLQAIWNLVADSDYEAARAAISACTARGGCLSAEEHAAERASAERARAMIHIEYGERRLAAAAFLESVRVDPGTEAMPSSWNYLRSCWQSLGEWHPVVAAARTLLAHRDWPPAHRQILVSALIEGLEQTGEWDEYQRLRQEMGYMNACCMIGPFNGVAGSGLQREFGPEQTDDLAAVHRDDWLSERRWRRVDRMSRFWLNLANHYGDTPEVVFYVNTTCKSETARPAILQVGMAGACKVWVNGVLQIVAEQPRYWYDLYQQEIELAAGSNRILVKIATSAGMPPGCSLRFADLEGRPLTSVVWSATPDGDQTALAVLADDIAPESKSAAVWWPYTSMFEAYASAPNLDRALMLTHLADTGDYEQDFLDEHLDAVLTAHQSPVLYGHLMTLALAADDPALASSFHKKIHDLCPSGFSGSMYRIQRLVSADRGDEAVAAVRDYLDRHPKSDQALVALLENVAQFGMEREVRAVLAQVESHLPQHLYTILLKSADLAQGTDTRRLTAYLEGIWSDQLANSLVIGMLATIHRDNGDEQALYDFLERIIELHPEVPVYSLWMAESALANEDFARASQFARRALELAPDSARAQLALGRVLEHTGSLAESRRLYRQALYNDPDNWDRRDRYLALMEQSDVLTGFRDENLMAIIDGDDGAHADAAHYVLVRDVRRLILQDYASRWTFREIGRVNDATGVEEVTQRMLRIPDNAISIDVARVLTIKPDGTQYYGETDDLAISFSHLAPGDYYELVYTVTVSCLTPMGRAVWDQEFLAETNPARMLRYQLIRPTNLALNIRAPEDVTYEETDLGSDYLRMTWTADRWEGMQFEPGAPVDYLADYMVDVSSVADWADVGIWYERQTTKQRKQGKAILAAARSLTADCVTAEDKVMALARFVCESIAYAEPNFSLSAVSPAEPRKVMSRGIGDCKDQSALLVALARSIGIDGTLALVHADLGRKYIYQPAMRFNHVIVALEAEGRTYWIDPARGYHDPSVLPADLESKQVLILDGAESRLETLPEVDASGTICKVETTIQLKSTGWGRQRTTVAETGNEAARTRMLCQIYRNMKQAELIQNMFATSDGAFFVSDVNLDEIGALERNIAYSFEADRYLPPRKLANGFLIDSPLQLPLDSGGADDMRDRQHGFDLTGNKGVRFERVKIVLPDGWSVQELPEPVVIETRYVSYSIAVRVDDDGFLVYERSLTVKELEVPSEDCASFQETLLKVAEADGSVVVLQEHGGTVALKSD